MKVFPITKRDEFKQTIVVLDSLELRRLIAEAIAIKIGIDINHEKNSFYYTNLENLKHLTSSEFEANIVAIHFIENIDNNA